MGFSECRPVAATSILTHTLRKLDHPIIRLGGSANLKRWIVDLIPMNHDTSDVVGKNARFTKSYNITKSELTNRDLFMILLIAGANHD